VELKDYVFEKLFDKKNIVNDTESEEPRKTDDPKEPGAHEKPIPKEETDSMENKDVEQKAADGSDEEIAEAIKDKQDEGSD